MGRSSKYDTHVKPFLNQIKEWKRQGATDAQVCEQLGVTRSRFAEYKKIYAELADVLKTSREQFVADLRGELARLAFKHTLKTTKQYITENADGSKRTHTEIVTKEIDGDVAALHLLLKNLDRDNWADNPQLYKLREQELELKKKAAEANNW